MLTDFLGFAAAAVVMVKAGEYAVKAITAIGKNLNVGHLVLSFFLVGLVSALPETSIAIISALEGVPHLGFGTLIGGAIADLTLVIGLVAIVSRRMVITQVTTYELWLFALIALLLGLSMDGNLSRPDGVILIGACLLFFFTLVQRNHIMDKVVHSDRRHLAKQLLIFLASASMVFLSANYVVEFAKVIASDFGLPLVVVGVIMLALATSLPETIFAIAAANNKMPDLAIGELFGVIMIDSTLLVGIIAVIHPLVLPTAELTKIGVFMLTSIALVAYFIRSDRVLTWREGVFLIFFYIFFLITELASVKLIPT